jgi:hypothetical protein
MLWTRLSASECSVKIVWCAYIYIPLNGFLCCGLDFSSSGAYIYIYVCVCVCARTNMYVCIYTHIEIGFDFVDSIIGLRGVYKHSMP